MRCVVAEETRYLAGASDGRAEAPSRTQQLEQLMRSTRIDVNLAPLERLKVVNKSDAVAHDQRGSFNLARDKLTEVCQEDSPPTKATGVTGALVEREQLRLGEERRLDLHGQGTDRAQRVPANDVGEISLSGGRVTYRRDPRRSKLAESSQQAIEGRIERSLVRRGSCLGYLCTLGEVRHNRAMSAGGGDGDGEARHDGDRA